MGELKLKTSNLPKTKEEIREFIAQIEDYLLTLPQIDMPVEHFFSHDCYGRKVNLPRDCFVIGKIHKFKVLNIVTKGRVSVMSPDIDGVQEFRVGDVFVSEPGAKRLVYTHEDSSWMNVHGTTETDLEKIEEKYIAKSYDEISSLTGKDKLCLGPL